MQIGSLFSGIGGLELGLERAGLGHTVWQVEQDEFCRRVLARHWPDADRSVRDVRDAKTLSGVDIICGGFPCQDISAASHGRGGGLHGKRTGLLYAMLDTIGALRPRFAVFENVDAGGWVPIVRRAVNIMGYASLPIRVRAADVGAPYRGSRLFVVAAPHGDCEPAVTQHAQVALLRRAATAVRQDWGQPTSGALGVAHGVPRRMDRLRALGNAVVPQCAEVVGRVLLDWMGDVPCR